MPFLPFLTPAWFHDTFLGIEMRQYIGIGAIVAIALIAQFVVVLAIRVYLHRAYRDDREFWSVERRRMTLPVFVLCASITMLIGFPILDFDPDIENAVDRIFSLFGAAAIVLVAYGAVDILTDVLARRAAQTENRLDDQLIPLLNTTLKVFATVVGILFILQNLDVNITSLIAGLGIGGLAVALAAQDTIKNLLGGITIFADRPFQVGDWVIVDEVEGTVEHVGFRSSRVRTFYNSLVTVPNAKIVDGGIDNMGLRRWRRYNTTLGIAYHTKPDQIQAFVEGVRALIRANPVTRKDYYVVEFHGFGAASLNILLYCFFDAQTWNEELRARHVLNLDIMRLAADLDVEFAFPTQTLHIASTPERPQEVPAAPPRAELAAIINGYAPEGGRAQATDRPISAGYDNG